MKVYTESGSCYVFVVHDNSLRTFLNMKEVIVDTIENLKIGERMTVRGHDLNIYCRVNKDKFFFTTSKVVKIEP